MKRQDNIRFENRQPLSRRDFLSAAGFTAAGAALSSCVRSPLTEAFAPVRAVEGSVQGRSVYYALACKACPAGCGMLSKNRDGRPIKVEGNPSHPLSGGGLCALGQAQVLGLYDSHRLASPRRAEAKIGWEDLDRELRSALKKVKDKGLSLRILSGTENGPLTRHAVKRFLAAQGGGSWVMADGLSCSALAEAHLKTRGRRLVPSYRLEKARVIFSVEADFLGTWLSPVEFSHSYAPGRVPSPEGEMSLHIQVESRLSMTGSRADQRRLVPQGTAVSVLAELARLVAARSGRSLAGTPSRAHGLPSSVLKDWADLLWENRGQSLVLCGLNDPQAQILAVCLNHLLDNEGRTLDLERPSFQALGDDRSLDNLAQELQAGTVGALVLLGSNPAFSHAGAADWDKLIRKVPFSLSLCSHDDESASACSFSAPLSHPLECWGDAEPQDGLVSICQPALAALGQSRSAPEILEAWSGGQAEGLDLVQEAWKKDVFPRSRDLESFEAFWDRTLEKGFAELRPQSPAPGPFDWGAVSAATQDPPQGFSVSLYAKPSIQDGRGALNPWLQELPDPLTKAVWDNYAWISPATADKLSVKTGDILRISAEGAPDLELPALVLAGPAEDSAALALGYGRKGTERFSKAGPSWIFGRRSTGEDGRVGKNASGFLSLKGGLLSYTRFDVKVVPTGKRRDLALTQDFNTLEMPPELAPRGGAERRMVEAAALADFRKDTKAGSESGEEGAKAELWKEDHPGAGRRWAMAVDLNRCTGCSACVIACQAENNVPVVGYDEALRHREMHWIRVDRYFHGDQGRADFQVMMCHHCGHAPCETVCPVLATVHGEEGLNQQVYNRCVGTRYCANNCPYKVRRFNWFDYPRDDKMENLALNPDVTVRSRGVMEKCSFCVQRILEAKIEARRQGRDLADGDVQTACQQSCPAKAISFGDVLGKENQVRKDVENPRAYQVLADLNLRPSVSYLRAVRNG